MSDYIYIDTDDVLRIFDQLDADRTNPGCVYTSEAGDHCIAGEVLVRLGCPVPAWGDPQNINTPVAFLVNGTSAIAADGQAVDLLLDAQMHADSGYTWGEAIAYALRENGLADA